MIAKCFLVFDPNAKIGHKCLEEVFIFYVAQKWQHYFQKIASWVFDPMTPKYTYIHTYIHSWFEVVIFSQVA